MVSKRGASGTVAPSKAAPKTVSPALCLVIAAAAASVGYEFGRRSNVVAAVECEVCAVCAAPRECEACAPKEECEVCASIPPAAAAAASSKGGKSKYGDWISDDEGLSLNLCKHQEEGHRCGAALADGVGDALTDTALFSKFASAGVPFAARDRPLPAPREIAPWIAAIGEHAGVRGLTVPDGAYGIGYLGELVAGAGETPFYAPQIPCSSVDFSGIPDALSIPAAASRTLGKKTDACNVWFGAGLGDDPDGDDVGVTALHYDHSHNVYHQHVGRKRFTLLPPHAREHLAPIRNSAGVIVSEARARAMGYVDKTALQRPRLMHLKGGARFTMFGGRQSLEDVPIDAFHNFKATRARKAVKEADDAFLKKHAIVVDLGPGDVLYIPPFWYHEVVSYGGVSVAHNHWWNTGGWLNQIMKKLDNVVSAAMPQTIAFVEPAAAINVQPEGALDKKCAGAARYGKKPGEPWPCVAAEPASPPPQNHQLELRSACKSNPECTVRDFPELLGETPTWHEIFAKANPGYRQALRDNGLLKKRSRTLK